MELAARPGRGHAAAATETPPATPSGASANPPATAWRHRGRPGPARRAMRSAPAAPARNSSTATAASEASRVLEECRRIINRAYSISLPELSLHSCPETNALPLMGLLHTWQRLKREFCRTALRPSRRTLRVLLRMRYVYGGIKKDPHPEEPAQRASRRTHNADPGWVTGFATVP